METTEAVVWETHRNIVQESVYHKRYVILYIIYSICNIDEWVCLTNPLILSHTKLSIFIQVFNIQAVNKYEQMRPAQNRWVQICSGGYRVITNVHLCVLKNVSIQKRDQFVNRCYLQTICKMKIVRFLDFEPLIEFRYSSGFLTSR